MRETDPKRIEAINKLIEIGVLIPFDKNLVLYHGRSREEDETGEWKVEVGYDNAGFSNINKIPALSTTTDYSAATKFAKKRDFGWNNIEVNQIMSLDEDAMIFNTSFDIQNCPQEQFHEIVGALRVIGNRFKINVPFEFDDKEKFNIIYKHLFVQKKGIEDYYTEENLKEVYDEWKKNSQFYSLKYDLFREIAGALNCYKLLITQPKFVLRAYLYEKEHEMIINNEFIASWLYHNNIVGIKENFVSGTLGEKIDNYLLFDLENINTKKEIGDRYYAIMQRYETLTNLLENTFNNKETTAFLQKSTPEETMQYMCKIEPEYAEYFGQSTHTWEGFSIGEHTEAALRIFEDSFKDDLPSELLPFMKLAIISHDIGKGLAKRDRTMQKLSTAKVAGCLFNKLNIDTKARELLQFVIGESQEYTTAYYVHRDYVARGILYERCENLIQSLYGDMDKKRLKECRDGLGLVCEILQACDSGAYTTHAIIKDEKEGNYFRGGSDNFTASFENYKRFGRTKIRFRKPPKDDKAKALDQSDLPTVMNPQSVPDDIIKN